MLITLLLTPSTVCNQLVANSLAPRLYLSVDLFPRLLYLFSPVPRLHASVSVAGMIAALFA